MDSDEQQERVPNPGDRVGAVSHFSGDTIYMYGYGVYEGNQVPGDDNKPGGVMGFMVVEASIPNPKIRLDNGSTVWGCECWWGAESSIQDTVSKFGKCEYLDIEADREKSNEP